MVVLVFVVAGCGGGGRSSAPVFSPGSLQTPAPAAQAKVSLSITIPAKTATNVLRHPATISPSTQSLTISVNGGAAIVFNATPTTNGCSNVPPTTCVFTFSAPVAMDTFLVTTYSAMNAGGAVLDQATMMFNVVAGANNANITLGPVVSISADSGPGSLRQAIADANAGDTLLFLASVGPTITLTSGAITIGKNLTISGPGAGSLSVSGNIASNIFVVSGGQTVTMSGMTLTHGMASNGGAIVNNGTLTVNNVTFTSNTATINGGAIDNEGIGLNVTGSTFSNNSAVTFGGAIYDNGAGTVICAAPATFCVSGSTFTNNASSTYGGAIYANDITSLTTDTFSGNSATSAAANAYGGAVYAAGQLIASHLTMSNNTVTCGTFTCIADGGGIAVGAPSPSSSIDQSSFTSNTATSGAGSGAFSHGGAIAVEAGTPTITNSTFMTNNANGVTAMGAKAYGAAIYAAGAGTLTLTSNTFNGNQAVGYDVFGGAVALQQVTTATSNTYSNNLADASAGAGPAYGGAVYSVAALNVNAESYASNTAKAGTGQAWGGGLYAHSTLTQTGGVLSFSLNALIGTGAGSDVRGGGIYTFHGGTLTNATFSSQSATADTYALGGGMYSENGGTLTGSNLTFNANAVTATSTTVSDAEGAGLYVVCAATTSLSNSTFTSNFATAINTTNGGGAAMYGAINLTSDTFTSNSATAGSATVTGAATGGGLGWSFSGGLARVRRPASAATRVPQGAAPPSTITGSTFSNNSAHAVGTTSTAYGGGASMSGGGSLMTVDATSTFSLNSATATVVGGGLGGGIYNLATLHMSSTLSGNSALSQGGGLWTSGNATITSAAFSGNTVTAVGQAADGGGGIYVTGVALVKITSSTINGNTTSGAFAGSGGGGINDNLGTVTVVNSTITGNSASANGGGILDAQGVFLVSSTLDANTATTSGGNVYVNTASTLTSESTIIAGGVAPAGPDVTNIGNYTSFGYTALGTTVNPSYNGGVGDLIAPANLFLGALAANGGPTKTLAELVTSTSTISVVPYTGGTGCAPTSLSTSPPIIAASITTDQRGNARGVHTANFCDIGAYEYP